MPDTPRYAIELVAMPGGDVPPVARLKRALKAMKRTYGLRAVRVWARDDSDTEPEPVATEGAS